MPVGSSKQPYWITMKGGEPFAMAGLWEWWRKGEQRIESFAIIVTSANDLCRAGRLFLQDFKAK
jgi:putative SOS response-associated peptidase YedK